VLGVPGPQPQEPTVPQALLLAAHMAGQLYLQHRPPAQLVAPGFSVSPAAQPPPVGELQ